MFKKTCTDLALSPVTGKAETCLNLQHKSPPPSLKQDPQPKTDPSPAQVGFIAPRTRYTFPPCWVAFVCWEVSLSPCLGAGSSFRARGRALLRFGWCFGGFLRLISPTARRTASPCGVGSPPFCLLQERHGILRGFVEGGLGLCAEISPQICTAPLPPLG